MLKLLSTVAAALLVGAFGLACATTAQDVPRIVKAKDAEARLLEKDSPPIEPREAEKRAIEDVMRLRQVAPPEIQILRPEAVQTHAFIIGRERGEPGTWTIVDTKAGAILLNTATGETYLMWDAATKPRWVEVQRPEDTPFRSEWKWAKSLPNPPKAAGETAEKLALLLEQVAKLAEQAKSIRDEWGRADDRDQRRKLAEDLEAAEDKIAKLNAEIEKLQKEAGKDDAPPRSR